MWPIWVCCKRLDQKRDKCVQSSSEIQLTLKRITKGKESGKKCGEMSRERAKQREATKHIYPTSSLRDMLHGVASAWVIRKLSQGNLCPRIQQRNASYASETKRERVERRILSVTFNLCGLTMEKNRGGKCSRRLVRGLWLSRFRRDLPSLPDSPPSLSHLLSYFTEETRKQPDLWTDFRPNKHAFVPRPVFGIRGILPATGCEMDRHHSFPYPSNSNWTLVLVAAGWRMASVLESSRRTVWLISEIRSRLLGFLALGYRWMNSSGFTRFVWCGLWFRQRKFKMYTCF